MMPKKDSNPKIIIEALFYWLIAAVFLGLWVNFVEPFPDRDSVHQLLFPYLNALNLSGWISSDPLFLKSTFLDTYPWGLALLTSFLGLLGVWELALQYPWHLPILFLIPTAIVVSTQKLKFSEKILFFIILFFCPMVQIALKSYSYHGLITLLVLPGALLSLHGVKTENPKLFWIGVGLIWYSATLKHLGAIHLGNLMLSFFVWKFLRQELKIKDFVTGFLLILTLAPFYPLEGLYDYIGIAFSHNPKLSPLITLVFLLIVGTLIWSFLFFSARSPSLRNKIKFFVNGRGVLGLLTCSILIISFGADQYSFELMALSFILGYLTIFLLLKKFDLADYNGLMLLAISITFTHGCILYFSFLGQIFANFFLPIGLVFIQSFYESNKTFRSTLAIFCLIVSNFSPSLNNCERWFWEWGHHYYTRGLNGLQHNPLGWEQSTLLKLRNRLTEILLQLHYPEKIDRLPVLFSGLHFHTRLQFLYPKNVWQPLPELHLPQFLRDDHLQKLANILESESETRDFIVEGGYPIIIHGRRPWTIYPVFKFKCESFHNDVQTRKQNWEETISDCLIEKVFENPELANHYKLISLKQGSQLLKVYIHKTYINKLNSLNYSGLNEFEEQWKWYQQLNWLQRILFQRVNPSERVFELFRKANYHMEQANWLEAWRLLRKGLEIEPNHAEILKDLAIVEEELGVRKREKP